MTRINSVNLPCGCRVGRFRSKWLPSSTCRFHDSPGLDCLRRVKGRVTP